MNFSYRRRLKISNVHFAPSPKKSYGRGDPNGVDSVIVTIHKMYFVASNINKKFMDKY